MVVVAVVIIDFSYVVCVSMSATCVCVFVWCPSLLCPSLLCPSSAPHYSSISPDRNARKRQLCMNEWYVILQCALPVLPVPIKTGTELCLSLV